MKKFEKKFEKLFKNITHSKLVHECSMHIENTNGSFQWFMEYGGKTINSPMVLASITKLFTTTCIAGNDDNVKCVYPCVNTNIPFLFNLFFIDLRAVTKSVSV